MAKLEERPWLGKEIEEVGSMEAFEEIVHRSESRLNHSVESFSEYLM